MKNIYGAEQKLDLEELFTSEEIKYLKKTFPKINILIISSPPNNNSNPIQHESSKDKIFIYKKHYYKLIIENIKNKYEQEGNNIMVKSLSYLIGDLFNEDNNNEINKNISNSIIIYNDNNIHKNERVLFNKKKQVSNVSLPDKKLNEINNEILQDNINMEKNNKSNKDEKLYIKNNYDYVKKLKSPNNNYRNIYYYNIINSKKIINNNNFKNDENKNKQILKNKKFIIKNEKPLYSINY